MVPSTGYLRYFALHLYDEGFVIQLPEIANPRVIPPFAVREKLFQVQKESMRWGDLQNIETVGDLNREIVQAGAQNMVLVQEAQQEEKNCGDCRADCKAGRCQVCAGGWSIIFR